MKASKQRLERLFAAGRPVPVEPPPPRMSPWFVQRVLARWEGGRANRGRDDWRRVSRSAAVCATVIMLLSLLANRDVFRASSSPEWVVSGNVVQCVLPR